MSGLCRTFGAALGAAVVVLAMVSPAFAATAAAGITILSAGPDSSGDPYNLTVTASDTNAGGTLMSAPLTAHVFSASMQDVADPKMTYVSGPPTDQVWVANPPIAESALPAGTYTVTVDASDSTGESDTGLPAPGSFSFAYATSSLTVTAAPPSVTQGSQNVTFNGTLTGTAPGGTPVGIANAPVNFSGAPSNPVATTDTNGNFSYAATGVAPSSYTFMAPGVTAAYPAASATVTVSAQQAITSMTVSASPATVTEGMQSVTFSGTVTATPPAPASPVSVGGVPVYLSIGGSTPSAVTNTSASGGFSYAAQNVAPNTPYAFSVTSTSLYTAASDSAQVSAAAAPTTVSVSPSPAVVTFGSPNVAFSGTVTALPQGSTTAVPVPGAPVYLNGSSTSFTTTDPSGHFSYNATGITQNTTDTFSVSAANSAGLYTDASDAVPVNVDPGTTAMTVTANPPDIDLVTSKVTFTGTVSVAPFGSTTAEGAGSGIPVYLSVGGGAASQVTTTNDASGDFSYTATGVKQAADYDFSVNSTPLSTAASKSVPIGQNQVQSTLTVTPTPASVTEGSQTVTFAGQLAGVSPSGGPAVAIQNAAVDLSINGKAATQIKTTDANGDFTYTVSRVSQKTAYAFSVASSATYTQATDDVTVAVDQARTRISHIRVTPAHLKYGQNATLRATVQYLSGTTWTALPRTAVRLAEGKVRLTKVTTASNGTFTATLPSTHGPGWTAVVNAASLTLQASAMGNLSIALPLKVTSFSASLGVNAKITASGCLEVMAPLGEGPGTAVKIQYSGSARGPWRFLGTLPLRNSVGRNRTCRSHDQSSFRGTLPAKLANAYYRADFAATYSYQAAVSKVVHAWKYPTRIVSFTANKHSISKNGTVRFRGRLEVRVKSWRPWGGKKVAIWYNYQGTAIFVWLVNATTNSRGYFTASATGTTASFVAINYALYAGNATHLACRSKGVVVRIGSDGATAVPTAGGSAPPLDLAQLDPLPLAVPLLPAYTAWPSIASLARTKP